MPKKYYVVQFSEKNPHPPLILSKWDECQTLLKKENGGRVKSFKTESEAIQFLEQTKSEPAKIKLKPKTWDIYTDGSFSPSSPYAGWAWIALDSNNHLIHQESGITEQPAKSNNIDGELTAVIKAITWLNQHIYKKKLTDYCYNIHHDYQGIASWYTSEWKAKTEVSQHYIQLLNQLCQPVIENCRLTIQFTKVTAHNGNIWNEQVDQMAKAVLNI